MHGGTINKVGKAGSKKTGTVLQKWKSTSKTTRAIGSFMSTSTNNYLYF